ncbi:MAG: lipoyl(octanoyl) transferase LipB [Micromonosporaceae bacterium]|nr:lipoyl(octanoyl) transferase LipB [Micromonosporaceae bacterium]
MAGVGVRVTLGSVTETVELVVRTPGTVDYRTAWAEQRRLHEAVTTGTAPDTVLLLEHPSVYTAGKRTQPWDRPADETPVVETDRGGQITWHGPGQLVGYPIVRLPAASGPSFTAVSGRSASAARGQAAGPSFTATSGRPRDVVAYVRRMEQLLIDACAELGLATTRVKGRSGVWVPADARGPDRKVAAIGVRVARGVAMHGFALNCDCDLSYFDRIVPCGIRDASVTSLTAELGRAGRGPVTVADALPVVARHLPTLLTA